MKTYLAYLEYGGDMECHECLYVEYRIVEGENEKQALEDYQQYFESDVSNGTWYGRKIKLVELPKQAKGCWKEIKVSELG